MIFNYIGNLNWDLKLPRRFTLLGVLAHISLSATLSRHNLLIVLPV
jgi:hypothetical protein